MNKSPNRHAQNIGYTSLGLTPIKNSFQKIVDLYCRVDILYYIYYVAYQESN